MSEMRCDICFATEVPWCHHCEPFDLGWYVDDGFWGLCDRCHQLVLADDWGALVEVCAPQVRAAQRMQSLRMLACFLGTRTAFHLEQDCDCMAVRDGQ